MTVLARKHQSLPHMERFLSHCHSRRYAAKSHIMRPGDPADTLYYVIEGSVTVLMEEDGRELILTYVNVGEFLGETGVFVEQPTRNVVVRSRTACVLAEISYSRLKQLFDGNLAEVKSEILYALGEQLSHRLLHTARKVGQLAFFDVTGRIARTLLDLCKEPDAMTHPDGMQIRVTRQELGRIVGCSREMAGRVLKNLEQEDVIWVKGKTIVVHGTR